MKTRVGKIARLPKIIRDQVNQKIEDCIPARDVLIWLNNLPEVQKILAEQFGGRAISKQNISEWRHGGYRDWACSREGRQQWWELMETAQKMTRDRDLKDGRDVTRYLGTFLIVELAQALDDLHDTTDSAERRKLMRTISLALSRLQTDNSREKLLLLKQCQQLSRNGPIQSSPAQSYLRKKISHP